MFVLVTALVSHDSKPNENLRPIVCIVNYNNFVQLSGSWGAEEVHTENSTVNLLLNYIDYANSFSEFNEKYPTVTISTSGKAISESTFGDVGRNKFGELNYPTSNFAAEHRVHHVDIINSNLSKCLTYYVRVNIGIGFKKEDTKLFLIPYINGILRSHGNYERYLDIGFSIDTITFNPRKGK
ncbi:hypothetical protein PV325_001086 [Microctonus aethiopoides]|nr:hypothetical protein PV325_001086 [Microctonus aethiopoides]